MTDKTEEITLGKLKYTIYPLTWNQLSVVLPAFAECSRGMYSEAGTSALSKILVAALGKSYPEFTEAFLGDLVVSPEQINAAVDAIARVSGLVQPKGEETAGASL